MSGPLVIPLAWWLSGTAAVSAIAGAWGWNKVDDAIVDPLTGNRPIIDVDKLAVAVVLTGTAFLLAKKYKVI